jgi:carboxypeptidase Taq
MSSLKNKYEQYVKEMRQIGDYNGAISLLHWDGEVNAPSKGAQFRTQQISTLSAAAHNLSTSDDLGQLLEDLYAVRAQLTPDEARNIELSLEDYRKATKLPTEFVRSFAVARSEAYQAWIAARRANDFSLFAPALTALIALQREKTTLMGFIDHPYNALLDEYEQGATVAQLDPLFKQIRSELAIFAQELREKGTPTDDSFLRLQYAHKAQWDFGIDLLKNMGYDFDSGRQDVSEHPFTVTFSPLDVRVTTRISENNPMSMVGTCIHEGGHALYEQGLPETQYGLPLGAAVSLGIHESQSRLWENNVGLSRAYWAHHLPTFQKTFPDQLGDKNLETFYKAINQVAPNFIRVEADELHYHLHVLVRYELEKALIEGSIEVADLDKHWNAKYKELLGVDVPDAQKGVLQDVHWCEGLMGYFPTYSLGSFYAAQFYRQACIDNPTLETEIANGDSSKLLAWLRTHIHQYGRALSPTDLCIKATGEPLNVAYFLDYARAKYRAIYDIV